MSTGAPLSPVGPEPTPPVQAQAPGGAAVLASQALPPAAPEERRLPWRRWLPWAAKGVVLAMVAGVGAFLWSVRPETWDHLREFDLRFVPVLVVLVGIAWLANGVRTWLLTRALGHRLTLRQATGIAMATEFGLAATPGGVGGVAVRFYLQKRLGITAAESASMLASDVAVDVVFFASLLPFAATALLRLLPRLQVAAGPLESPAWLAVLALVVVIAGVVLWRRPGWLRGLRRGWADTWRHLAHLGRRGKGALALCLVAAAVQFAGRYGVLPVALLAFGVHTDPLLLMFVQGALFFLGLVIALPGGGGAVELLSNVVLPLFAPAALTGLVVIVWRFFTYHLYVLVCGFVLWRQVRGEKPETRNPNEE